MKSLSTLKLSLFVSTVASSLVLAASAMAANTDWPFPENPKAPATPNPFFDVGTCKIVSQGLIVVPGLSTNPAGTSHFGETIDLSYTLVNQDPTMILDMKGTTGAGKPDTRKIETILGVSIGSDYQSFSYYAPNQTDELRSFTIDLEVTERTKNDVAVKAILSTLAQSKAKDRSGKEFIRTNTTRYLCDLKPMYVLKTGPLNAKGSGK